MRKLHLIINPLSSWDIIAAWFSNGELETTELKEKKCVLP